MIARSVLVAAALAAVAAGPQLAPAQQRPHPAVVRVIVPERGAASFGSGALVAVSESHGLVVTNWHVICDAAGAVTVAFPDGFRSRATVLAADRDWDLAALAIDRPPGVEPIPLAAVPPRPGDVLWIAGYGRGAYRASAGRCTQYVAPGRNLPFEMVELSTAARKGDSGGPILNARGELAGVLFGAGRGRTTGSYCGRVRWFLGSVGGRFEGLGRGREMIAQNEPRREIGAPETPRREMIAGDWRGAAALDEEPREKPGGEVSNPQPADPLASIGRVRSVPEGVPNDPNAADPAAPSLAPPGPSPSPNRSDQIKTVLAAIGVLAIAFHGLKALLAAAR
jgi:hypothetical protein